VIQLIIDAHLHIGPLAAQYVSDYSLSGLLEHMKKLNITHAISCNTSFLLNNDFDLGVKQSISHFEQSNKKIQNMFYYHPGYSELSLSSMKDYVSNEAFVAIKIHPSIASTSADDESYRLIWEFAYNHDLPLVSHTWDVSPTNPKQAFSYPALFEKYVKEYPNVKLVLAHSGGRYNGIVSAVELGKRYDNVYFDVAGDIWVNGFMEYLVNNVGSHRIVYGSDYSMMDQRIMLGIVLGADISLNDKQNILCNTARIVYTRLIGST
jgi:uncharacterized protein